LALQKIHCVFQGPDPPEEIIRKAIFATLEEDIEP
jgi:hypothetical protein